MRIEGVAERLRIALISERFGRKFGGAEAYAVNLFEILSRRHDVTVIGCEFDHDLPVKEVHVKIIKWIPSWIRALYFAYQTKKLSASGYDLVHTHALGSSGDVHVFHVVPVKYRRFFMKSRWQGYLSCFQPRNIAYLWLELSSLRFVPGRQVVAVSPTVCKQLHTAYPSVDSIELIPPGALAQATDPLLRSSMRQQLDLRDTDIVCIMVARNPLLKGFAVSLQALEKLPEHYKLLVLGADREARQYLFRYHPEIKTRVKLIDATPSVSSYYQSADICVHPTLLDSFGMAPLEAMAHGLPVVLSAESYCGFAGYVRHMHDAWVLNNPRDAEEMVNAIFSLGENLELRVKLVRESETLVQFFSWDSVAQQYETLYMKVLSLKKTHHNQPLTQ